MDAGEAFRQGLGSVSRARQANRPRARESSHESEEPSTRIAHTLAACCRCRQRKTRCDPTLPKCLPCDRAGAQCEYFDTSKNKKISRLYVIRLQDRVRALQLELGRYVDEDADKEHDTEESIRPGGLVRLEEGDETPRYLGPSSGIAMTRLVMEEARRYTDSRSIRELVPEITQRRTPVSSPGAATHMEQQERKRSYPMISAIPAVGRPSTLVRDKLIEVFNQKAQYLFPTLHEPSFYKDCLDVYREDPDPYKNFVFKMVMAISMQKLDVQYAGLADSYYLAAMQMVDEVIKPKDLKTLQCLVLIAQYSLMTPTKTPIYYIVGLATKLCQQLGLSEEKTIKTGFAEGLVDPLEMDMRRRLSWIVLSMEMGLAHSLGRPNGFATSHDHLDVGFFQTVDDMYITPEGITSREPSEKKIMAVHFFKMRLLQAEIRRTLYQRKRTEPRNDQHPWFKAMEKKMRDWLDASPTKPAWSKPWFTGKLNTMLVFLFRPSPQVPKPSTHAAHMCYDASAYNIQMQWRQMKDPAIDITWIFLQSLFMAVNTLLWSISYPDVRAQHPREDVEKLMELGIDVMEKCTDRWPGSDSASQLYQRLGRACLKAYDGPAKVSDSSSSLSATSPASGGEPTSPISDYSNITNQNNASVAHSYQGQTSPEPPPMFNFQVFNQSLDQSQAQQYHQQQQMPPPPPTFRSNSIFNMPSSRMDRRFSYFPPDVDDSLPPLPSSYSQPPIPQEQQQSQMQNQQSIQRNQQISPPLQQQQQQHSQPHSISQQQPLPPTWNAQQAANQAVQWEDTSPPLTQPTMAPPLQSTGNMSRQYPINTLEETSYFIQPSYNFGPQYYGETAPWGIGAGSVNYGGGNALGQMASGMEDARYDRMESLTYDQQQELMRALEDGGIEGLDELFGLESQQLMFSGLQ